MKLRLVSGEIKDAEKDCECSTHSGPHWIHMDSFWKEKNRAYLKRCQKGDYLSCTVFSREELQRLKEKEYQMKSKGVIEIIREELEEE